MMIKTEGVQFKEVSKWSAVCPLPSFKRQMDLCFRGGVGCSIEVCSKDPT